MKQYFHVNFCCHEICVICHDSFALCADVEPPARRRPSNAESELVQIFLI